MKKNGWRRESAVNGRRPTPRWRPDWLEKQAWLEIDLISFGSSVGKPWYLPSFFLYDGVLMHHKQRIDENLPEYLFRLRWHLVSFKVCRSIRKRTKSFFTFCKNLLNNKKGIFSSSVKNKDGNKVNRFIEVILNVSFQKFSKVWNELFHFLIDSLNTQIFCCSHWWV